MWTNAERQSAIARSIETVGSDYILPIRVDDTDLDGIPSTIGYVDLRTTPIPKIAEMFLKKHAL